MNDQYMIVALYNSGEHELKQKYLNLNVEAEISLVALSAT